MKKKILAIMIACVMAFSFALVGCGGGGSSEPAADTPEPAAAPADTQQGSSSVSSLVDSSATQTQSTSSSTDLQGLDTSAADPTGLRALWPEYFQGGAEGVNANGEHFYFAFDDPSNITVAALMITSPDGKDLTLYVLGEATLESNDEYFNGQQACVIHDVEGAGDLPFIVQQGTNGADFDMYFIDDDVSHMTMVDQDTIINDMITIWEGVQAGNVGYNG